MITKSFAHFCLLMTVLLITAPPVEAQQAGKVPRIGFLTAASQSSPTMSARIEAFRQGLHSLGYVDGKNIVIEQRYAEGKLNRLPALVAELIARKVDIIVSAGPRPTQSAKDATTTIPIVMTQDTDPIGNGFITSLPRPGKNITGLSTLAPELSGKRLGLLKELIPKLLRVAVLETSTYPGNAQSLKEAQVAAQALGIEIKYVDVLDPKDIEPALQAVSKGWTDAALVLGGPRIQPSANADH